MYQALLLALSTLSAAQNDNRICAWYRPRHAVVRDALYIDGGTILENGWRDGNWLSANPTQTYPSGKLHAFNFSNAFEGSEPVDLRALLSELSLTGGGSYDAPDFSEGAMFGSDYELYTYGGLPRSDASSSRILNYRLHPVDGQTIFTAGPQTGIALGNNVTNYVTSGGSASAPSENKGWYFSGMRAESWGPLAQMAGNDPTDPRAVTTHSDVLITADLSSPGRAIWQNSTLPDIIQPRINPELVWVPVADEGVLLAIGGVLHHQKFGNYGLADEQITESEETSPSFMQSIPVYDIAADEWHVQNTTGEAPDFRAEFCAVVASLSDDTSTFDIYVYGGDNGLPGSRAIYAHDDVWVLSVPSFHWVKVSDGSLNHGRSGHTCSMPFPNQMLIIGGQNLDSSNLCIQDGSVADVFNLNTLQWSRTFSWDSFEEYRRPRVVSDAIEDASGPTSAVQALFDTTYRTERKVWYPYASPDSDGDEGNNGTTTIITATTDGGGGINAGAIAGGVVGGVAVLVAGFLIFWFCRPSRRSSRKSRNSTAYTETTLGASAVSRWLRRTNFNDPPQGQTGVKEGSETDGTVSDDHVVPATHARPSSGLNGPAELYGDTKARHEMSTDDGFSPRSSTVVESVYRPRHASVEAGSQQIHEMLDESTVSPRQSVQKSGEPYMWQADKAPFAAIDEKSVSEIHTYPAVGSQPDVSNIGSDTAARTSADQLSRPSFGGPERRPAMERNESSISSELPTTPPSRKHSNFRMSANSAGPISPMLEEHDRLAQAGALLNSAVGRPVYRRHGSSLISAVSESDREVLRNDEKTDGDRLEAQRILEGKLEEVSSPAEISPLLERKLQQVQQSEMLQRPQGMKRAASSASRFKEEINSDGN